MLKIKENNGFLSADLELCVHMMTFVSLWKLGKYSDSAQHVEISAGILNKIIQRFADTKISKKSTQNLYCLIVMSMAGLRIRLENDVQTARKNTEDCRNQLQNNRLCYRLLSEFIARISGKKNDEEDFLVTNLYQKVLFVCTFMPLISPNTPMVKLSDLQEEQEKMDLDDSGSSEELKPLQKKERERKKEKKRAKDKIN